MTQQTEIPEHRPGPAGDAELAELARRARWLIVQSVARSKAGHVGGPLSVTDLLVELFFEQLSVRPQDPGWEERDRVILSKGHSAIALYAVMALRGYFPEKELQTFDRARSRLQGHPDMTRLPGLDMSTGSLGQGLSVGVGFALGARMNGDPHHTWVVLGDGEMQEGMVWEAVSCASRYRLGNLTAIIDRNHLQQFGWTPGDADQGDRADPWARSALRDALTAFGWRVTEIDGHDFRQIREACDRARAERRSGVPTAIIASTVKGKGLSFTENSYRWHTGIPDEAQLALAYQELFGPGTQPVTPPVTQPTTGPGGAS